MITELAKILTRVREYIMIYKSTYVRKKKELKFARKQIDVAVEENL